MSKSVFLSAAAIGAMIAFAPASASERVAIAVEKLVKVGDPGDKTVSEAGSDSIILGQRVDGRLSGASEVYTLEGTAGQRVRIALSSSAFDTVLGMTGPGGFTLENDDEPSGESLNSLIETVLPADGTYELTVSAYAGQGRGAFRLATFDMSNPSGGRARPVSFGQTVTDMLTASDQRNFNGAYVDYFSYQGEAGQRLTFDLTSDNIDTVLSVYMPDGAEERNDDFNIAEGTDSRLSITLPVDGEYTIAASSYAPATSGRYTLTIGEAAPDVRTVRPASGNARVFALTVGVADYRRMNPLDRTDEDATRIAQAMAEAGVLAPESVNLVNAQATRANFESALTDLTSAMGDDDLLLIFFSGHGDKVEGVTTERDGSAETLELYDMALHDYELVDLLADVDARTLLVIDACFAGGFDNVVRGSDNRMGIFSSDEDVLSLVAQDNKAGGYISHIFRAAMRGDADMNGDRAIGAGELSEYMRREFYRLVLDGPLDTDAEDFRNHRTPGWQNIVIDRGGDGMPHQQVLMNLGSAASPQVARAD